MDGLTACTLCGAPPEDEHHITGRKHGGAYLDADLVVALCHDHHELAHEDLRAAGIDAPTDALSAVEQIAFRLRRLAQFFGRLAVVPMDLADRVHQ